jgi:putative FmdB family regulatory protein
MAIYTYKCEECGKIFEEIKKDRTEYSFCPVCDSEAKVQLSVPSPAQWGCLKGF